MGNGAIDEDTKPEPGRIVVSRTSASDLKIRDVEMRLDGRFFAIVRYGYDFEVEVEPGKHRLTATNRMFSKSIDFTVGPGETAWFLATGVPLGGLWNVLIILATIPYKVDLARLPDFGAEPGADLQAEALPGEEPDR